MNSYLDGGSPDGQPGDEGEPGSAPPGRSSEPTGTTTKWRYSRRCATTAGSPLSAATGRARTGPSAVACSGGYRRMHRRRLSSRALQRARSLTSFGTRSEPPSATLPTRSVAGQRIQSGPVLIDTLMIPTATIVARDFTECFIIVRVVMRLPLPPVSCYHKHLSSGRG